MLVLVLVDTVVLVVGGVVVAVVVGLSVVVVVGESVVELGCEVCVTVWVPSVGAGRTEALDDVGVVVLVLEVVDVELDPSSPVSATTAYTISASRMTPNAPRLTRPAGVRYHGVGGSTGGGGCCPYWSYPP